MAEKDRGEPSNKGKDVGDEAVSKELIEITSEEIFAGCDSIEKV